jgi:hypothetical protein
MQASNLAPLFTSPRFSGERSIVLPERQGNRVRGFWRQSEILNCPAHLATLDARHPLPAEAGRGRKEGN